MVSDGSDDHENPELEMSGILEEFLMPSSPKSADVRASMDSLKDGSLNSLAQSNNSSLWTSSSFCSSCSCHSISAHKSTKSTIVFHSRPILPPLLCNSSRTEMMIYKKKAMEREQRRKQKEKQRLISRVEAILAGVELTPPNNPLKRHHSTKPGRPDEIARLSHSDSNHPGNNDILEADLTHKDESTTVENADAYDLTSHHGNDNIIEEHNCDVIPVNNHELTTPTASHDTSSDSATSFHDNAYKSSLRNLLKKSMSFTANDKTPPPSHLFTSVGEETVIETQCEEEDAEETFVRTIVESAIKAATDDLFKEKVFQDGHGCCDVIEQEPELPSESVWRTPKLNATEEGSPFISLDPTSCNLSTSTKVNSSLDGDKEQIESTVIPAQPEVCKSPNSSPDGAIELSGTICFESTLTDDLTMLRPVLSHTVSNCFVDNDTKENCDPTIETGSLKLSASFTDDQTPKKDESSINEAERPQEIEEMEVENDGDSVNEEKKMLRTRVRRGSYTLDEPSPYLVRNRESLTIESWDLDEGLAEKQEDVIRKLHLPSDSEESSLRTTSKKDVKPQSNCPSRAELSVTNLCRILQDQHKAQMEAMKHRHQEQLEALQKELIHGEKMSLPPLECAADPRYSDVTISPSLASTEYRDIRLLKKPTELRVPEYSQHSPSHHDVTMESNNDISRITEVQVTLSLHEKLCKFSALCKGHLTRKLLGSNKVQEIMQVIRDTSSLILSLRMERSEMEGADSVRDSYLEERLYTQLRSAMLQFHEVFFETTIAERMFIVAQSCLLEKVVTKKFTKPRKLSTATQKSLERKRLLSSNSPQPVQLLKSNPKEVKSKISHIWKSNNPKMHPNSSSTMNLPSRSASLKKTSPQIKQKSPVTSQLRSVASHSKKASTNTYSAKYGQDNKKPLSQYQKTSMTSQKKNVTSQNMNNNGGSSVLVKDQNSVTSHKGTSRQNSVKSISSTQRKLSVNKKIAPLSNRVNTVQRS